MMPFRIVSLIPSATEIVCALGFQRNLVGISHECDYPNSLGKLPVCTASKQKGAATSSAIHRDIKGLLEQSLSVYEVDTELLHSLKPTHIITQDQCDVCAVSKRDLVAAMDAFSWTEKPKLVSLTPRTLEQIVECFHEVALALDAEKAAMELAADFHRRRDHIRQTQAGSPRRSIACIEWLDPLMASGNWVPEMVRLAGGESYFAKHGEPSPWISWQNLLEVNPERLLIKPCGFSLEKLELEMTHAPWNWRELDAGRRNQIYLVDGNQYFNRPGPRIIDSLEILAEILHPERFQFGFEGKAWRRFRPQAAKSEITQGASSG